MAKSPAPGCPSDVEDWLRSYPDWLEQVASSGLYVVPSDTGSRIQSNRAGRPTERTALALIGLNARCRVVEGWKAVMSPLELSLLQWYTQGTSLRAIAAAENIEYMTVWGMAKALPFLIWSRHYSEAEFQEGTGA